MSYCSETLKEIFLELPLPAGGMVAVVVDGMRESAVGRSRRVEAQMVMVVVVAGLGLRLRWCGGVVEEDEGGERQCRGWKRQLQRVVGQHRLYMSSNRHCSQDGGCALGAHGETSLCQTQSSAPRACLRGTSSQSRSGGGGGGDGISTSNSKSSSSSN